MTSDIKHLNYESAPHLNWAAKCGIVAALIAPILIFYLLLIFSSSSLPFLDDYQSVLQFLNVHVQMHGLFAKTAHILTFQHAQYKLIFEAAVFVAQRALMSHVNFLVLTAVGDSFVLILLALLSLVAFPRLTRWHRMFLLVPVAYLLFQLQYAALLNWSVGSLQHFPLLCFAMLSLLLLTHDSWRVFCASCVALLLCIASSGNGFFLCVSGWMLLLSRRDTSKLVAWCGLSVLAFGGYLYRYNFQLLASPEVGATTTESGHFIRPLYSLSFLGSSAAGTTQVMAAIVVGLAILISYCLMTRKWRYDRKNPTLFYFFTFILLTAISVSLLRGSSLEQSLASRYRIYSNLAIALAYIAAMENLLPRLTARRQVLIVSIVTAVCSIFSFVSDRKGYVYLLQRRDEVRSEMLEWEHPELKQPSTSISTDPILLRHRAVGLYKPDPTILRESIRLGVYYPPMLDK